MNLSNDNSEQLALSLSQVPRQIIDTKVLASSVLVSEVKAKVEARVREYRGRGVVPKLAIVLTTSDAAVLSYLRAKQEAAAKLGVCTEVTTVSPVGTQADLEKEIVCLSKNPSIHGVLLEFPVGKNFDAKEALKKLSPDKDVDGLTAYNMGLIATGNESSAIVPATPQACIALAQSIKPLQGVNVAVIGSGATVGRPLSLMLLNRQATVTVCNSHTKNLSAVLAENEFIFSATGVARLIGKSQVKPYHCIIDAGISVENGSVTGDVAASEVLGSVAALSPVPGGVGPLTTAFIFNNLLNALDLQSASEKF